MPRPRRKAPVKKRSRKSAPRDRAPDGLANELREALEQQAATAEVLKTISSPAFDLQSVLDAMTRSAARLCRASDSTILLLDGDAMVFGSHFGPIPVDFSRWKITRNWTGGRAVLDRKTVHVRDMQSETTDFPEGNVASARMGYRTILTVPMMHGDEPIGALTLRRTVVQPFTAKQVSLAEGFATQAVIAIENARLLNELRESLERQTATSEVLGVISRSPGALGPVFVAMLESATRICGAKFGVLYRYDGAFSPAALVNAPPAYDAFVRKRGRFLPQTGNALDRLRETRRTVHSVDEAAEPVPTNSARLAGARSQFIVPMLKDDELVGAIAIYRQEVRPFTEKQIELVKNFAAQAVIAIENTRLLNELRQRTTDLGEALEQQTATSEVLQVISRSPGALEPVFESMLVNATRICEAKFGVLMLREGEGFRSVAIHGAPAEYTKAMRENPYIPPRPGSGLVVLTTTKQPVQIADLMKEPGYANNRLTTLAGARTLLIVPMLNEGQLIGAINIYRQETRPFNDKQVGLLTNFAAQAVIAIENTRLLNELRQRTEELRQLNEHLEKRVSDQVSEIERMGRLRRFLPPQVADLIVSSGAENELQSHRREITALFCDLRGFTGFAESADPEDVMALLREYHNAIGKIIFRHGGTLERFVGDGVMVIFNDPLPLENPSLHAVQMALEMRAAIGALADAWRRRGHEIGFGIGIAQGYATLGTIGFEGRYDYAAVGTVSNVASRLCDEAKPGQILISPRVLAAVEGSVRIEQVGELSLKGIRRPLEVYNVVGAADPS